MNESGQGFSVFRLLISAIMGLMILLIVLGVYDYFNNIRLGIGYQRIVDGFITAANKHDGTVIKVENAELPAGTDISSFSLSQGTGIDSGCIQITGPPSTDTIEIESDRLARINHYANINVYIMCETPGIFGGCEEVSCTVSLNKKIVSSI